MTSAPAFTGHDNSTSPCHSTVTDRPTTKESGGITSPVRRVNCVLGPKEKYICRLQDGPFLTRMDPPAPISDRLRMTPGNGEEGNGAVGSAVHAARVAAKRMATGRVMCPPGGLTRDSVVLHNLLCSSFSLRSNARWP